MRYFIAIFMLCGYFGQVVGQQEPTYPDPTSDLGTIVIPLAEGVISIPPVYTAEDPEHPGSQNIFVISEGVYCEFAILHWSKKEFDILPSCNGQVVVDISGPSSLLFEEDVQDGNGMLVSLEGLPLGEYTIIILYTPEHGLPSQKAFTNVLDQEVEGDLPFNDGDGGVNDQPPPPFG